MGWGAAAAGALSLLSSKSASDSAERSSDKASDLTKAQIARLDAIDLPDIEKQKLLLENPELVGLLDSEQLDPSALEEISLDPAARDAQLKALESLQEYGDTGITDTDKYAMEQMLGEVDAATKSNQAGIEADMARRGMDSSGAALMAKQNAQQSGANNAREKAMQMAAQGQQNRMGALSQLSSQAGNMQQQDFARQAQVGSAKDVIAQANAANRYQTNAANLGARQSIENQRANLSNQQQTHNKGLQQQQFQNELSKAGQQNVASQNAANTANALAGSQAQAGANMMNLAGTIGSSYLQNREDGGVVNKYEDGGVHSNFQDGIEARKNEAQEKEDKQRDAFKKKYMKQVHDELIGVVNRPDIKPIKAEDGAAMYASDGQGDIVDSGMESYAGDRVDAKINDGEAVLNVPQQQRFMDLVRGKISVDELGNDDIVEGVPSEYRDELHEDLESNESGDQSTKLRGLEALLQMLGEE